jgi:acetyl-CoA acetyltransferase
MLASARPDDLALVVAEVASRSGVHGEAIDEVILGATDQAGEDNREGGRRGLATLCVGVGQGVAVLIEAV